jgi:hypothetical protein
MLVKVGYDGFSNFRVLLNIKIYVLGKMYIYSELLLLYIVKLDHDYETWKYMVHMEYWQLTYIYVNDNLLLTLSTGSAEMA